MVRDTDGRFYVLQDDGGLWVTPMNTDTDPLHFGMLAWSDGGIKNFVEVGGARRGPFTVVEVLKGTETKQDLDKMVETMRAQERTG